MSKRWQEVKTHMPSSKLVVKLTINNNLRLMNASTQLCEACFIKNDVAKTAKYPDEHGYTKKLCALHAHEYGTHFVRSPCIACPSYAKKSAGYKDEHGNPNVFCAEHAKANYTHELLNLCHDCLPTIQKSATFPDKSGKANMLCTAHAKLQNTFFERFPCLDCLPRKITANYANANGNYVYCARHARLHQCFVPQNACRDCADGAKMEANFDDEFGNARILCSLHAKAVNSHHIMFACSACPDDAKIAAGWPDKTGKLNRLCCNHAKDAGTYFLAQPCRDCSSTNKLTGRYPDEFGKGHQLCATHARIIGTYFIENPCELCPEANPLCASFPNAENVANKLCAEHSYLSGLSARPVTGCSKIACEVWDRLEKELDITLQHAHYANAESIPSRREEFKIPTTNFTVDAVDHANKVIYEYNGPFHGVEESHSTFKNYSRVTKTHTNASLLEKTLVRLRKIKAITGFKIYIVWYYDYAKIQKKKQPVSPILRDLDAYTVVEETEKVPEDKTAPVVQASRYGPKYSAKYDKKYTKPEEATYTSTTMSCTSNVFPIFARNVKIKPN